MSRDGPEPAPHSGADRPEPDTTTFRPVDDPTDETLRQHLREASTAAFRKVEASAPPPVANRMREFRERIRKRRSLDTAWRVMVLALGLTLVSMGLIMLILPGPGFGALILGLVVLASEFTWATRVLDPVKEAARRAQEAALDPRRRRRNLTLGAVAGVVLAMVLIWYLGSYGLALQPILEFVDEVMAWFTGLF